MFSRLAVVVVCLGSLSASPALAQQKSPKERANALVEQGSKAAKTDLNKAIALFKEAEKVFPRAVHHCNLGLAFVRLKDWPRTYMYLDRCRRRWSKSDGAAPPWIVTRLKQAAGELAAGEYAQVLLRITPSDARVTVSAFAADEPIEAGAVWLPFGEHTITAAKPGLPTRQQKVSITDRTRRTVTLDLAPATTTNEPKPAVASPPPTTQPAAAPRRDAPRASRTVPWVVTISGGVTLVAAGVSHLIAIDKLDTANNTTLENGFHDKNRTYRRWRGATIGLYAVGAVGVGAGLYLLRRASQKKSRGGPTVGGFAAPDRAYVSVGWSL